MLRLTLHAASVLLLTLVTQIGGLAWAGTWLVTRRRGALAFVLVFALFYAAGTGGVRLAGPAFGRVALPCGEAGPGRAAVLSPVFCALNRAYVVPGLAALLDELAVALEARFPGTRVMVLDAGFPFIDGFPLLPHLSHDDGRKADLAFWYTAPDGTPLPGVTRSPLGYWAFETPAMNARQPCVGQTGPSLRWNMGPLQRYMADLPLDEKRTAAAILWLAENSAPGAKILIEPHLADRLNVAHPKVRFQGCRAARHDDHIHVQL